MGVELPKDAEGREIPLDTVVLFGGNSNPVLRQAQHHHQERAGIGLGYDAVRRPVLPLRRRWPEGLLVRWRRPEPCEGGGCGLLEREGKR